MAKQNKEARPVGRPVTKNSARKSEAMAKRHAAGESFTSIAGRYGLTPAAVAYRVNSHNERSKSTRKAA